MGEILHKRCCSKDEMKTSGKQYLDGLVLFTCIFFANFWPELFVPWTPFIVFQSIQRFPAFAFVEEEDYRWNEVHWKKILFGKANISYYTNFRLIFENSL